MNSILLARITNPALGQGLLGNIPEGSEGSPLAFLLARTLRTLVIFGAILMILYLLIGGINWITAEGKPDKLEKARNQVIQALTGMILLTAVIAISSFLGTALGFPFLQNLNIELPSANPSSQ